MPSGTPRSVRECARTEINFLSPPSPPPFFMQCTQRRSLGFRYPRRTCLAELIVLYEGTILAVVYDDSPFTDGFTWTWNRLLGNSYLHIPYRFLPRHFLLSLSFRRCGVTGAVCCGSGWISLLPLESWSPLIWSAVEDVGRARSGSANTPVAGMVTSPRRRLARPEHCARGDVQCRRGA